MGGCAREVSLGIVILLTAGATAARPRPPPLDPTLLAAGDIASCSTSGDEATAKLLDNLPGTIATLGDLAYSSGTPAEFECYDASWGRHKTRTKPAPGNHEYETPGASGYFDYFGAAAGDPDQGYYSYNLGTWHLISLNSNCSDIGGCGRNSDQGRWLAADLEANPSTCTLAYWHHPLFNSGSHHGNSGEMADLWAILDEHDADVVLSAHEHVYERFAPQDKDGNADPMGIRQFTVGTGGRSHYAFSSILPNSEAHDSSSYGVLEMKLQPLSYEWRFVPTAEGDFSDSGTADCVGSPECSAGPEVAVAPVALPLVLLWRRRKRRRA